MLVRLVEREPGEQGTPVIVQTLSYVFDQLPDDDRIRPLRKKQAWSLVKDALDQNQANSFGYHSSHIVTDELALAAGAFVLHCQLSEDELDERARIIRSTVQEVVGPLDGENPEQCPSQTLIDRLNEVSFLYPTACLDATTRVASADAIPHLYRNGVPLAQERISLFQAPFENLAQGSANRGLIEHFIFSAIHYLTLDELAATGETVAHILEDQALYQPHVEELFRVLVRVMQPPFLKVRGRALRAMQGLDLEAYKEALDDIWAEANEEHERYYADQLRIIHWMIDKDLPTRPIANTQRKLLQDLRKNAEEEARAIVDAVRSSVEQETEQEAALRQAETQRMIGMVLAEIEEEPAPTPKRGGTRKKQKKKPKKGKNQTTRNTPQTTPETEDITVVETDSEQDSIQRLRQYLDFVDYELGTLLTRLPEGVDGAEDVNQAITGWRSDINALLEAEDADLDQFTTLARACDHYLTRVRRDIRALLQQVAETTNFENSLRLAIQNETVSYGRNFGGVLRRGLGNLSWSDVDGRFHNRYLSAQGHIEQGGVTRLLAPDEALALYVTSSSRSGYDFDISCHYWERRPGSSAPPDDGNGFMNSVDWYDTLVPCFVLHVPK